jgi:hypothetical protein
MVSRFPYYLHWVRFHVLMVKSMKMAVLWDVVPCGLVGTNQRFRGAYCLKMMMEAWCNIPYDSYHHSFIRIYWLMGAFCITMQSTGCYPFDSPKSHGSGFSCLMVTRDVWLSATFNGWLCAVLTCISKIMKLLCPSSWNAIVQTCTAFTGLCL